MSLALPWPFPGCWGQPGYSEPFLLFCTCAVFSSRFPEGESNPPGEAGLCDLRGWQHSDGDTRPEEEKITTIMEMAAKMKDTGRLQLPLSRKALGVNPLRRADWVMAVSGAATLEEEEEASLGRKTDGLVLRLVYRVPV